jgi:hypothetical protein
VLPVTGTGATVSMNSQRFNFAAVSATREQHDRKDFPNHLVLHKRIVLARAAFTTM